MKEKQVPMGRKNATWNVRRASPRRGDRARGNEFGTCGSCEASLRMDIQHKCFGDGIGEEFFRVRQTQFPSTSRSKPSSSNSAAFVLAHVFTPRMECRARAKRTRDPFPRLIQPLALRSN